MYVISGLKTPHPCNNREEYLKNKSGTWVQSSHQTHKQWICVSQKTQKPTVCVCDAIDAIIIHAIKFQLNHIMTKKTQIFKYFK